MRLLERQRAGQLVVFLVERAAGDEDADGGHAPQQLSSARRRRVYSESLSNAFQGLRATPGGCRRCPVLPWQPVRQEVAMRLIDRRFLASVGCLAFASVFF